MAALSIAGVSLTSCIYEDEGVGTEQTIGVNADVVQGTRAPRDIANEEDPFTIQFWLLPEQADQLLLAAYDSNTPDNTTAIPEPYWTSTAPQPVPFYSELVYDTGYPYPYPDTTKLCATGYAPSRLLERTNEEKVPTENGKFLTVKLGQITEGGTTVPDDSKKGRYDFLGCDLWRDVYAGSQDDPFAQDKNKLYFRHLAAKLAFYADRNRNTTENKQFVRNVRISNIRMKIGDGASIPWEQLHTPEQFRWTKLSPETDFTSSYLNVINSLKQLNSGVTSNPEAGYKTYNSTPLPSSLVMSRNAADLVPVDGIVIDSCFVCNPIVNGASRTGTIQLMMDISAELSFSLDFPNDDSSSTTDDLTYTRTWTNVPIDIKEISIDNLGNITEKNTPVTEFKPGNEYRIYLHFFRTDVYLTAIEMPWNYGGVHYIPISAGGQPALSPK